MDSFKGSLSGLEAGNGAKKGALKANMVAKIKQITPLDVTVRRFLVEKRQICSKHKTFSSEKIIINNRR